MEQFTHLTEIRSGLGIRGKGKRENRKRVKNIPYLTLEQGTANHLNHTHLNINDRKEISDSLRQRHALPHPQKEAFQEIILNAARKIKMREAERKRRKTMKIHFYTLSLIALTLLILGFTL